MHNVRPSPAMTDLASLRIIEIGDKPYVKQAFPEQTTYFSTYHVAEAVDPARGMYAVSLQTIRDLRERLQAPDLSLIVCHPTFFSPWHWRWLGRAVFDRRILQGQFPFVRALGPQLLRERTRVPIAVLDQEDLPVINRSNFFLLDRCRTYFKRELPVDRWHVFLKTGHPNLPTPRFRRLARYAGRAQKIRPLSMGLPMWQAHLLPWPTMEKKADVFFAGRVHDSSWVRQTGFREINALRERGIVVDIPDQPLPPEEFYRRCAQAWLTWSPEGFGWECFRHYEAPACGSVPVINSPTVERHKPLVDGEHAIFYTVENGGLTQAITTALADKERLKRIAAAGRAHVLAHHTPRALAEYIVRTTLGLATETPDGQTIPSDDPTGDLDEARSA